MGYCALVLTKTGKTGVRSKCDADGNSCSSLIWTGLVRLLFRGFPDAGGVEGYLEARRERTPRRLGCRLAVSRREEWRI